MNRKMKTIFIVIVLALITVIASAYIITQRLSETSPVIGNSSKDIQVIKDPQSCTDIIAEVDAESSKNPLYEPSKQYFDCIN